MQKPLIEVDTTVNAQAKQVWRTLTASKSAMFMGAAVDTDWREGSPISFTGEFKGKPYRDHGEIRTLDEGRELAFTHFSPLSGKADSEENYHLVDVRLSPDGDKTRVSVSQNSARGRPARRKDRRRISQELGGDARRAETGCRGIRRQLIGGSR